jgi:hypothetical protein
MLGHMAALRKSSALIKQHAVLRMEGASLAQLRHALAGYNAYWPGYSMRATPDELPLFPHNRPVPI